MTSKAQRRAAKRRQEANRRRAVAVAPDVEELVRPFRLIVESLDELGDYAAAADDPAAAEALATARVRDAVERLIDAAAPYDPFDVLEVIRVGNMLANPETYDEAIHEGSAAVVEVVALALAARGTRSPVPGTVGVEEGEWAIAEQVQEAAEQVVRAGGMLALFGVGMADDRLARIGFGTVLREASLRNAAYPHMVADTLAAIFDDPAVEAECRRVVGVTHSEIQAVHAALQALHGEAWDRRFDALDEIRQMAQNTTLEERKNGLSDQKREHGRSLLKSAWEMPAACSTFTVGEIASKARVPKGIARAAVDLFTTEMTEQDPADAVIAFFRGDNVFRTAPILRAPDGSFVVVHGGLLLPAVRERLQTALAVDQQAWDLYVKHRGEYLEASALDCLKTMLPAADVHSGFEYFVPDPDATPAQQEPAAFTKIVETDGLLIADDVAVILEAKAVALRPRSRTGDPLRLRGDLRKTITDAADQADRLRRQIVEHGGVRLRDGSWLDLSHVRETHMVAVSLDDLSGIATLTTELVAAGLLPHSQLPWTVGLHDLRIISELVARPPEFVLYLRRRTEPEVTLKFHAVDELDLFLHMYQWGLYVEPDPDAVYAEVPQFGKPTVGDRRRRRNQPLEFITSLTGELDAWYFYRLGYRTTPAAKPAINCNQDLLDLVDQIAADRKPGWLAIGTTLLDGDTAVRRQWARHGPDLLRTTGRDGRPHSYTVVGGTRPDNSFVLAWFSYPSRSDAAADTRRRTGYLAAKKHQVRAARGMGLVYYPGAHGPAETFYDSNPPGPDPVLDAAGANLRPLDRSLRGKPPPARKKK